MIRFFHHRDTESTEKNLSVSSPRSPQGGRGESPMGILLRELCVSVVIS